ncbi:alpha/beta hydrolase [Micromonospora sp. WMMD812]|uniref:alpha/beta hydrolase n=1 Tax=Micromonospora sp. WMMD812 TaxID=3015152 RepID=UPI00248AB347|nr:alpha/beta hydrolase [Micromonospora sp. WMMD812]WBB65262.1 alpha/beta hydrolase [Micromonospora sp. WMMD812]
MLRVRKSVGWTLAVATAVALIGAGGPPAAAARSGSEPTITWRPCDQDRTAECGTLSVPVDWSRPDGERFDLALARRTATDRAERVGSLVFGPGGPGDSGVDRVVTGMHRFSDDLRRRFDIVSFDPRGVGRSHPVVCATALLAAQPQVIEDQAQFAATLAGNARLRADCRARTGPLFDHVDTLSAARDLEAVRVALGERRLTFHGSSYGTLLGLTYAEQFPHRVRAMVLEAAVDHSLGTRSFLDTQAATVQDSFDEFVAWCAAEPRCALHGRDVRAVWAGLWARAEQGELADPDRPAVRLTPFLLSRLAQKALYGPDWPGLAADILTMTSAPAPAPAPASAPAPGTTADTAVSPNPLAVFCQDWALPVRDHREYAAHLRRAARIALDLRYPQAVLAISTCLGTPTPVANPQHRLRVRTDVPLLVAATRHDPASGFNWATNVARQLGRHGVLLTYEGWGHGSYTTTPCVGRAVDRYLVDVVAPARGARCPAVNPTA